MLVSLFLLSVTLFACDKDDNKITIQDSIVGSWSLEAYYGDPGDGSGDFEPTDKTQILTFMTDGTYTSGDGGLCGDRTGESGTYSTETLRIEPEECGTIGGIGYRYELADSKLLIYLPCIESCIQRYVRVDR